MELNKLKIGETVIAKVGYSWRNRPDSKEIFKMLNRDADVLIASAGREERALKMFSKKWKKYDDALDTIITLAYNKAGINFRLDAKKLGLL